MLLMRIQSGIGTIYLWIILISAFPTSGYSLFYQDLPVTFNTEQVYSPFSESGLSGCFHFEFYPDQNQIFSLDILQTIRMMMT